MRLPSSILLATKPYTRGRYTLQLPDGQGIELMF
jgi:hypothetical protein